MLDIMSIFVAAIVTVSSGQDLKYKAMEYVQPEPIVEQVNPAELNCLAKTIYYEAGSEPEKGKFAVGFATANRIKYKDYPNSVCKIVKQRTPSKSGVARCQYNWYCVGGERRLASTPSDKNYAESLMVAKRILSRDVDNWMPRVVSFCSTKVNPRWGGKLSLFATIGGHKFYERKDS